MGWAHVDIFQDYVPPPKKDRVENHVSGDEPETLQEATYAQVVTWNQIEKIDGTE